MKRRCHVPTCKEFVNYGARGITVCGRWRDSFGAFIGDIGPKPSRAHSLDRIDNNGNYEPGNCRWATWIEQQNNTRKNTFVEFAGEAVTIAQLYRRLAPSMTLNAFRHRLNAGWSVDRAMTQPAQQRSYAHEPV